MFLDDNFVLFYLSEALATKCSGNISNSQRFGGVTLPGIVQKTWGFATWEHGLVVNVVEGLGWCLDSMISRSFPALRILPFCGSIIWFWAKAFEATCASVSTVMPLPAVYELKGICAHNSACWHCTGTSATHSPVLSGGHVHKSQLQCSTTSVSWPSHVLFLKLWGIIQIMCILYNLSDFSYT